VLVPALHFSLASKWRASFDYLKHLTNDFDVTLLCTPVHENDLKVLRDAGIKIVQVPYYSPSRNTQSECRFLAYLMREGNSFDLFDLKFPPRDIDVFIVRSMRKKARIVFTLPEAPEDALALADTQAGIWHRLYSRVSMSRLQVSLGVVASDVIVVSSKSTYCRVNQYHKIRNIAYIPEAIDLDVFRPVVVKDVGWKGWPTLIYVGNLVRRKGVCLLPFVMKELVKEYSEALLLIVGDGPMFDHVKGLSEELGTIQRTRFFKNLPTWAGPSESLVRYYNIADIFITASYLEGFCLPAVEAMATGTPFVARDSFALSDHIRDSGAGVGFESDDPLEVVNAVKKAISNYDSLSTNAVRYARLFSSERVAKLRKNLYEDLLGQEP
jgi:glycosyltransferase involved in cell wall biosynthesis